MKKLGIFMTDKLPRAKAPILWHCGYWDGPLSGVCLYEDRVHWFETHNIITDKKRQFFIYEMTDEEISKVVTEHFLFEHYVGIHTCAHATLDGKRQPRMLHPQERWSLFYNGHGHEIWNISEDKEPIAELIR